MMPRVRKLWNGCKTNKQFREEMRDADTEDVPSIFCSVEEKNIWASFYYGWLVAKYGKDWEQYV